MRTILLDADCYVHLAALATRDHGPIAVRMVYRLAEELSADRVICCWSCPREECFRRGIWPAYKQRRSDPPAGVVPARKAMREAFVNRDIPALEADDVIGILATCGSLKGDVVIVANDKDLLTVPGLHHVPRRHDGRVFTVTQEEADRAHLLQTLTGDGSDGYPGCPGVGPKRAAEVLIGPPAEWWPRVVLAYQARGLTTADALAQARVARILRSEDYDLAARRVIAWTPGRLKEVAHAGA